MGTNFYLGENEGIHIGKRSAAGLYCWDCEISLCKEGYNGIHNSTSKWFETCPMCGKSACEESLENSTIGRELGFNKNTPTKKTGVSSCSSFSWAINPLDLNAQTQNLPIKDEYGETFTPEEFKEVLKECPVMFLNMIGKEFS